MEPIDENEEHVINETVNNESYVGDLEANNVQQPSLGMEFESQEDAYSFYVQYAKSVGFGVFYAYARRKFKILLCI